jgi:hypothetical protein
LRGAPGRGAAWACAALDRGRLLRAGVVRCRAGGLNADNGAGCAREAAAVGPVEVAAVTVASGADRLAGTSEPRLSWSITRHSSPTMSAPGARRTMRRAATLCTIVSSRGGVAGGGAGAADATGAADEGAGAVHGTGS